MPLPPTCCTCATILVSEEEYRDSKSEKPRPNHRFSCCGRIVCARCVESHPRFATYCPFCQTPSLAHEESSSSQNATEPPPYTSTEPAPQLQSDSDRNSLERSHESIAPPRTPPPEYEEVAQAAPQTRAGDLSLSDNDQDVVHFLAPSDTLHSLSLAYRVPLPVLRAHNRLHSDHLLSARQKISIPRSHYSGASLSPRPVEGEEESERKANLKRFMLRCKCADYKIATLYLEEQSWNLEKAMSKYIEDEAWERDHPLKKGKGRLKLRS